MLKLNTYLNTKKYQFFIAILSVIFSAFISYLFLPFIGYKSVAIILLFTLSLLAMLFDIGAVLIAATLSALIWDFFFIPPLFAFSISNTDDKLIFAMYFVIAMVNAALTYKIKQNDKIVQQQQQKENTIKLYNTLLNSLSHELKTPIATIIGATDNLQDNATNLSANNKIELISEISKASLRLNHNVENLLNMSRLESGTLQLKRDWCDVNELIYNVTTQLKDNLKLHTVSILIPENLPFFKLDSGLLETILYNLILNSSIYVPPKHNIHISAIQTNNQLVLAIEDDGNGFPENEVAFVFDKFYRLKSSSTGGTGLGLSIVKGFVEAHNGIINLKNKPTSGAKFTIIIPCEIANLNSVKND